jgi:thiol-disulfide isomerase/thioredoxin
MVEAAAAALAVQQEGGEASTDGLDPGAIRQAELWLASLQQRRFAAQAEVDRAIREREAAAKSLGGVVGGVVRVYTDGSTPGEPRFPTIGQASEWAFGAARSRDFRGSGLLVTAWASWCAPCRKELAWLDDAVPRWRAEGAAVQVLAVGVDQAESAHAREVARLRLTNVAVVHDPSAVERYGIRDLPYVVLIDADGVVREVHVGWGRSTEQWLDSVMQRWARKDAARGGGG